MAAPGRKSRWKGGEKEVTKLSANGAHEKLVRDGRGDPEKAGQHEMHVKHVVNVRGCPACLRDSIRMPAQHPWVLG